MNDLIYRQQAIKALDKDIMGGLNYKSILNGLPTIQPDQKNGKWVKDGHHIQCNQCGINICDKDREGDVLPKNFCPNCGAKMKEGRE